jgi:uncharacterized protein (DUF433 family)
VTIALERETFPLTKDPDGTIRVAGTSVPIEAIVYGFLRGESPDEIVEGFPAVSLADAYATIGFYLRHRDAVDTYLREREAEEFRQRAAYEAEFPRRGPTREELLARWQSRYGAPFPQKRPD